MMVNVNNDIILESLEELADIQFQERVWVKGKGPEVSSLEEAICGLFDDSCLGMVLDKQGYVYNKTIDAEIRQLSNELARIDTTKNIEEIVPCSEWRQIASRAGKLRQRIREFLLKRNNSLFLRP